MARFVRVLLVCVIALWLAPPAWSQCPPPVWEYINDHFSAGAGDWGTSEYWEVSVERYQWSEPLWTEVNYSTSTGAIRCRVPNGAFERLGDSGVAALKVDLEHQCTQVVGEWGDPVRAILDLRWTPRASDWLIMTTGHMRFYYAYCDQYLTRRVEGREIQASVAGAIGGTAVRTPWGYVNTQLLVEKAK